MRERRFGFIPALGVALLLLAAMATTGSGTTLLSPSRAPGQAELNIQDLRQDLESLQCKAETNPAVCERIHELTRGHPESIMEHLAPLRPRASRRARTPRP
jgi:hypothetical protein